MATADEIKTAQDILPDADPTRLARKRRRKTQSNGAVEDCFACQKRQTACDRRRPYCSPCLELGKECSGYRTVLTWGVGVASRGKLRGMSLPVPIPGGKSSNTPPEAVRRRISFNVPTEQQTLSKSAGQARPGRKRSASIKSDMSDKSYNFQQPLPSPATIPEETPQPPNQTNWQLPPLRDLGFQGSSTSSHQFSNYMPPPMHIPDFTSTRSNSLEESPLSSSSASLLSATSISTYSDTSTDTQFAPASISSDKHYRESYPTLYDDSLFSAASLTPGCSSIGQFKYSDDLQNQQNYSNNIFAQQPDESPHSGAYGSHADTIMQMDVENDWPGAVAHPQHVLADNFDFHEIKSHPSDEVDLLDEDNQLVHITSAPNQMPAPTYVMSLYPVAPRMRQLLDYYDKCICPVLVAFDGPSNPYRMYMMQLAFENAGLQNAIAALVTNNMRMRTAKTTPRTPVGSKLWELDNGEDTSSPVERPTAEEQHYRVRSIEHLNAQLTNPIKARDDSVLATLLILCLFHICDSGVSKFKTQLAGVQKLLRMRGQVFHSEFVGWVEMFFAWLDVMTSAVNDREIQIHGESLDLMNLSANLGALEQYSGIDGRLFKLIARLSRLNLLSQSRPVRDASDITPRGSPQMKSVDHSSPIMAFAHNNHGDVPDVANANAGMSDFVDFNMADPDGRTIFWQEWRDLRQRLKDWDYYNYFEPTNVAYAELPSPQRDMQHISESFRYSALLYTERLAFPNLPSSSLNFQELVNEALYHCTEIPGNSCILKFMLWPMFIIGTECVDEQHRELIRERCIQIQEESGFYNNMNGLRVLERVWKEYDEGTVVKPGCRGQAFRWRNAMNCVDGEYIVI